MPSSIVFKGHLETGWMHDQWLFGKPLVPSDLVYEHRALIALRERNPGALAVRGYERMREFCETPKPMVMWMYDFVKEFEGALHHEPFSWTFEWHITSWYCSEESENAIESSPPYWYVTIRDFEGVVVHKHWSIAFDATFGDLDIVRSVPSAEKAFWKARWRERSVWLGRVLDAVREHQRIRNYRLKRLGIEVLVN